MSFVMPKAPLEGATKQLKIQTAVNGRRKLVISTNLLLMCGYLPGTRVIEQCLGPNQGMDIRLAEESDPQESTKATYLRRYRRGKMETYFDIRKDVNLCFGSATHVHITFTRALVRCRPVFAGETSPLSPDAPLNTVVACTGGVDVRSLEDEGFSVSTIVEYRPNEARDKRDRTEINAMCALQNASAPKYLINEDLYRLDIPRLTELLADQRYALMCLSLQCDQFSTLTTHKDRRRQLVNCNSTIDMIIPALRLIEALRPHHLLVENVVGFANSDICQVFELQLRRLGYGNVEHRILDPRHFGGLTSRKRMYLQASCHTAPLPWPTPEHNVGSRHLWRDVIAPRLGQFAEVTNHKSVQRGIATGRARFIEEGDAFSPTIHKSQDRGVSDSVYVKMACGKILKPSVKALAEAMGLPADFLFDGLTKEQQTEIIGQSIEVPLHRRLAQLIRNYIQTHCHISPEVCHGRA